MSGGCDCESFDGNPIDYPDAELYHPLPAVSRLSPSSGPHSGGSPVVITGRGFTNVQAVRFGDAVVVCPSAACAVNSAMQITVTSPPHADGAVGVVVVANGRTSPDQNLFPYAAFTYDNCGTQTRAGQVAYRAGYSLIGMPTGTSVPSQSFLYSWFDLGAGGSYRADDPTKTQTVGGHGYWVWFSCAQPVTPAGSDQSVVTLSLSAYHASMIGNPSAAAAMTVSGHDFAAAWDQSMNSGRGGYIVSGYRQGQSLAVGQGTWVFSYAGAVVSLH